MCSDPNILVCVINTKLRDLYDSLDRLCEVEDINKEELIEKLKKAGFIYNDELNQFK